MKKGELDEGIRELKAEPEKPIGSYCRRGIYTEPHSNGLIDEYTLATNSVALGSGLPIFTDLAIPLYLKLADVKAFAGGAIAKTYQI